jgi:hypothetical protein
MGWGNKISKAKKSASESVSEAKENVSSKIGEKTDSLSESIPDSEDLRDISTRAKKRAGLEYRYAKVGLRHPIRRNRVVAKKIQDKPFRTLKGLMISDTELVKEIVNEVEAADEREATFWATVSYQDFAAKGAKLKQPVYSYGTMALDVSKEINPGQTYQYGKYGAKAGAKYGDYIPIVGNVAPHLGFVFGSLIGAADSADAIEASKLLENLEPASDAAEEMIQDESDRIRNKMFKGGVAYAESRFGQTTEPTLDDLTKMDYDDFANR